MPIYLSMDPLIVLLVDKFFLVDLENILLGDTTIAKSN